MSNGSSHNMNIFHDEPYQPQAETRERDLVPCRDKGMRGVDAGALCLSGEGRSGNARHGTPTESRRKEDKHKAPTLPNIHPLSLQNFRDHSRFCHPERSEGSEMVWNALTCVQNERKEVARQVERHFFPHSLSAWPDTEILRCAQDDKTLPVLVVTIHQDDGDASVPKQSRPYSHALISLSALFCIMMLLFTACDSTPNTASKVKNQSISTNNGVITYSTSPQDVLIRTFYGGGKLGSFEYSPEISIYGDGSYILGPGLQMREGQLSSDALGQLLHILVDTDGLLKFTTKQFYDIPDQNATFLQLMLNGTSYTFQYGPFGNLQESAQDRDAYHRLGAALTSITGALNGPTHPYAGKQMALLVHQDFNPDLSQTIPNWSLPDFNLYNLAVYECGAVPLDQTGPNGDTGCLTYTVPHNALLLSAQQQQLIISLLKGQSQGVFLDLGQYYSVTLRPLLPDEIAQKMLAMLGSAELVYTGVPLQKGPVPTATPTR